MTAMFGNANYAVTVNSSDLSDEKIEAYSSTVGDFHLDQIAGIEQAVRASVGNRRQRFGGRRHQRRIISTAAQKNIDAAGEYYGRGPAEGLQRNRCRKTWRNS